jgi:hypothetical protein
MYIISEFFWGQNFAPFSTRKLQFFYFFSTTNLTNFAKFNRSIHQILNITIIKTKIIIYKIN